MGIGYLEFEIKVRKADETIFFVAVDNTNEVFRFVDKTFAYTHHDARYSTSSGRKTEQIKRVGPFSTILSFLTHRDGDLSTYFEQIDENECVITNSTLKQLIIHDHTTDNRGLTTGTLPLEKTFGFCKSFKKITKGLGFELEVKTSTRKRNILYTLLREGILNVTKSSLSL